MFGTDHAELNMMTGRAWNLPDETISVLRHYLAPSRLEAGDLRTLALSLAVASWAADHYCLTSGDSAGAFAPPAALYALARQLEVQPSKITRLLEEERSEVQRFIYSMVDLQSE